MAHCALVARRHQDGVLRPPPAPAPYKDKKQTLGLPLPPGPPPLGQKVGAGAALHVTNATADRHRCPLPFPFSTPWCPPPSPPGRPPGPRPGWLRRHRHRSTAVEADAGCCGSVGPAPQRRRPCGVGVVSPRAPCPCSGQRYSRRATPPSAPRRPRDCPPCRRAPVRCSRAGTKHRAASGGRTCEHGSRRPLRRRERRGSSARRRGAGTGCEGDEKTRSCSSAKG